MDTKLKQRLIGGAVLIALAVIFLPMLVHGPAPDSGVGDVSTRVPDAPAGKFETRELPLGPAAGQAALPAPAASAPAPAEPSTAPTEAPGKAATVHAPADPDVAAGQWAVSFGAYASARDADAVLSRLRQAGLEGFREEAELNGRQAWRVRVGPYPDRALAEAGRLQAVRIRNDVNAQVIALDAGADAAPAAASATARPAPAPAVVPAATPAVAKATPEPTAPVEAKPTPRPAAASVEPPKVAPATPAAATPAPRPSAPAASDVGFAVQLGAFASQAEAHALRDRLRAAGFSAIVQPVPTAKGTLNRVRVGPVATRAEAEQLKSRLAAGFGNGNVVQHP
ncbi:MAG: SPOR domain-containing protein [Pseudoxanthomonas sp.]|nr:SPOR domain-containing protein [Pseudoxanthomonas sp.]MBP8907969.1 SPOR domain-containing protein [Pseudoxanthomonas sp.]MBP9644520.1 SPOR domain-containing protein [Pseudoxanthomonas sp.]